MSGCQMVRYSNGGLKTGLEEACLWSEMSGIQMVKNCLIVLCSRIQILFEYQTKFSLVFRPHFSYHLVFKWWCEYHTTIEYWTCKSLTFKCLALSMLGRQ